VGLELLVPDLGGSAQALALVVAARPSVLSHNLETVPRLYPRVRAGADYGRSLELLQRARSMDPGLLTKSGLMLGLGEEPEEVLEALADLRRVGCRMLTLGQYLAPSPDHLPVTRYLEPSMFAELERRALDMGFKSVAAGPLVRSSFLAEAGYRQAEACNQP
jgi:lipoic acid synthetase